MGIARIDEVLAIYDEHFPDRIGMDPKLEFILVQALLIVIYSEFEKGFNDIVVERFSVAQDSSLDRYIASFKRGSIRGLQLNDIVGFIGRFGQQHKDKFNGLMRENQIACNMYTNIVLRRHAAAHHSENATAHGSGDSETISSVKEFYEKGRVVLDLFKEALWIGVENYDQVEKELFLPGGRR